MPTSHVVNHASLTSALIHRRQRRTGADRGRTVRGENRVHRQRRWLVLCLLPADRARRLQGQRPVCRQTHPGITFRG